MDTFQSRAKGVVQVSTGFAVITENDQSKWDDETGIRYHYPKMYQKYLEPGTKVLYYKGRIKDKKFEADRLSNKPHYFAVAEIARIEAQSKEQGGGLVAYLSDYQEFAEAIPHKVDGKPFEVIPDAQKSNYWRRSVRDISGAVYRQILDQSTCLPVTPLSTTDSDDNRLTSTGIEGNKKVVYSTVYERDRNLRKKAIEIHGLTCKGCGFNFGETYGPYGEGFIHVHHVQPLFEVGKPQKVDPQTDLVPLCANCHCIVHRRRNQTLSVEELKAIVSENRDLG